jgi:uncharacterized membrane protein
MEADLQHRFFCQAVFGAGHRPDPGCRITSKTFAHNPVAALLLFSVNPILIWAASEIRCWRAVGVHVPEYTVLIRVYIENPGDRTGRVLFILFSTLGVFTQYFFAFVLIGNFVFLLFLKKWDSVKRYLLDMIAPVVLLFVLLYPFINQQIQAHTGSLVEDKISLKDTISFVI